MKENIFENGKGFAKVLTYKNVVKVSGCYFLLNNSRGISHPRNPVFVAKTIFV